MPSMLTPLYKSSDFICVLSLLLKHIFRRYGNGFNLTWIISFYTNLWSPSGVPIHGNLSKILLLTQVVADNITCNENVCIELETKAQ